MNEKSQGRRSRLIAWCFGALAGALLLVANDASALPAFARQTGQDCAACHVGAFGPQLTPFGIRFKIDGYTDGTSGKGELPFSAMLIAGYTHTAKDQADPPSPHTHRNDNVGINEASLFLAGRLADHVGALVQATYDGVAQTSALDNADLRIANTFDLAGRDVVAGVSVNNNPGVQDPFNTMPAWGFPFTGSDTGFTGGDAATMINGGLEHRVLGASVYALWDNTVYGELGTYRALSPALQSRTGQGRGEDMGRLGGSTAYWRLAWMKDMSDQAFQAGVFCLKTSLQPDRLSNGPKDRYDDLGVDASYQFLGLPKHVAAVYTSYIRERQNGQAMFDAGNAQSVKATLKEFKLNATYTYDETWTFSAGRFATTGRRDALRYADGYANGSPDTSGYVLQADWTPLGKAESWGAPWANLRLGLQYTMFDKFNGASHNYDGAGRDAKDNNTVFLFAWASF
ncbi:cytochrome C [Nitrogeniibacter mangrovi]|uniref:Cytochrome C n=1 Tax=Nitrogeniibacter mangrovi TaxID=2016596 RepID=A0A6C1B3V6_9RHOO|nr:cytochrome C [Nitrogeniibacter mangrovi]QID18336.1 cytochrome C [Nitrogeniibacter mangrovi]